MQRTYSSARGRRKGIIRNASNLAGKTSVMQIWQVWRHFQIHVRGWLVLPSDNMCTNPRYVYVYMGMHRFIRKYVCMHKSLLLFDDMCVQNMYECMKTNGYRCVMCICVYTYGMATISRLLKIIGLFCRISSLLQVSLAKENYFLNEPTNRSQPPHTVNCCPLIIWGGFGQQAP